MFGIGAIFMYVGGEVTVGSSLVNFLGSPRLGGLSHEAASRYLSYYWGGLMIGRFMGAFALSDIRPALKRVLVVLVPVAALVVVAVTSDADTTLRYGAFLGVLLVAFFLGGATPQRMLALFSGLIVVLLAVGIGAAGETAKVT